MPIRPPDTDSLHRAAALLQDGDVVAFPTETVYGLGADATQDEAVAKIFAVKGRPHFNPLITHIHTSARISDFCAVNDVAEHLIAHFWPGALTLVLPRAATCPISRLASAGLETVALRMPAHPVAQALLEAAGCPIAAPSANRSGHISSTTAMHVDYSLSDAVPLILDGGPCQQGLESTVLRVLPEGVQLLRPGIIPRAEIETVTGPLIETSGASHAIASPGQLESHYAPNTKLRLNASYVNADEALLAFGDPLPGTPLATRNLSPQGDMIEAAAALFDALHELDKTGCTCIAVMPIPEEGLGEAINDRLRRAAAPRS